MSIVYVEGDLFAHQGLDGLAHGCNCIGAMGAGVAVEFKKRFPRMFTEYRRRCLAGEYVLGDVFPWKEGDVTVFNLATQKSARTPADLPSIERALHEMVQLASRDGVSRIGLPRLGADVGGLAWEPIRDVLETIGGRADVELVVFEKLAPTA